MMRWCFEVIDASNKVNNTKNLSIMVEEIVLEVGIVNVMQVVTNNAIAYMVVQTLL